MGDKGERLTSPSDSKHRDSAVSIHSSLSTRGLSSGARLRLCQRRRLILITAKYRDPAVTPFAPSLCQAATAQVKLRIRREHVCHGSYFVSAPLILTFVTCRCFRQVFVRSIRREFRWRNSDGLFLQVDDDFAVRACEAGKRQAMSPPSACVRRNKISRRC